MKFLICYDIPETKLRNKVVKYLQKFSYRLQYSVFLGEGNKKELDEAKVTLRNFAIKSPKARILVLPLTEDNLNTLWLYGTILEEKKDCMIA